MYFLVNASPSQVHRSHYVEVLSYILCDLDPKVKVIGKKTGFAMVYHRLLL